MAGSANRKHLFQFTLRGLDELKLFPDEESRQKALQETSDEVRARDIGLGAALLVVAVVGVVVIAKLIVRQLPFPIPRIIGELTPFVAGAATVWVSLVILHRWGTRQVLRKKLVRLGIPVCIKCGYLLRGLSNEVKFCPECGHVIEESVRAVLVREQAISTQPQPSACEPSPPRT